MTQTSRLSESQRVITPPPFAVAGLILSMALVAVGNGLIFAYVPTRLGGLGYPPSMAGWILTGMAAGGFLGCLAVGPLVKRVGHARAFMTLAAVMLLTHLLIGMTLDPILWIGARFAYGFAVTGLFIIAQSWIMAIFYMSYVLCIGLGGYLIAWIDLETPIGPMIAVLFGTLAILPVGLTNLPSPPPPEAVKVALRAVWRISPVGLAGLMAVGGLTMMVQGFAPIYAQETGYSQSDIGLLVFLMQFGMIAVQMPLGALSDRMDRRIVLIIACVIIVIFALICTRLEGMNLWLMIALFGIWAGATETTVLTDLLGVTAYMYVAVVIALSYGLFVAYRIMRKEPVPEEDQEAYEPRAAQAAYAPDLAAPAIADEIDQQVPR